MYIFISSMIQQFLKVIPLPRVFLLFALAFPSLAMWLPLSDVAPPQRCGSPVLGHGAFSSALTIKLGVGGRAKA
jgi:hypothetical protein